HCTYIVSPFKRQFSSQTFVRGGRDVSNVGDNVLFRSPASTYSAARDERFVKTRIVNLKNFFAELKRRNVYKVAIAYAVVAWLLMQVASQIFPFFDIPNWAVRLVVLLLIIGFPVALILAWAFEV